MKKQLNGPVVYIDPKTGLKLCDSVKCKKKFTVSKFRIKETKYKWHGGPVIHKFHYSECVECGRSNATSKDKVLTNESFKRGTLNAGMDPDGISLTDINLMKDI